MVYLDTPACAWHWQQLNLDNNLSVAMFHVPFPFDQNFVSKVVSAADLYEHVLVLCSEIHNKSAEFIKQHQRSNIHYFACGFVQDAQTYPWMDWFHTTGAYYKNNTQVLDQLRPNEVKPKYFDILLGQPKSHRDRVYQYIKNNNLDDQVIMTYLVDHWTKSIRGHGDSGFMLNEPGLVIPDNEFNWTVTRVNYLGYSMSLSQVVPIHSIYNETAYTVITETNFENHYAFFTEKTCKPILAQRLFIMLGGQYYLRNLRELGFKTFDGIIDESYDLEPNNHRRWDMAIEQMQFLFEQPQAEILAKVKPIAEHNRRVMLETNWDYSLRNFSYLFNNVK